MTVTQPITLFQHLNQVHWKAKPRFYSIFLSSTFVDTQYERNEIVERVKPILGEAYASLNVNELYENMMILCTSVVTEYKIMFLQRITSGFGAYKFWYSAFCIYKQYKTNDRLKTNFEAKKALKFLKYQPFKPLQDQNFLIKDRDF